MLEKSKFYLLGVGTSPKTSVDIANGYLIGIQYLAPADLSGNEVCTHRTNGCTAACYNTAGRGAMAAIQNARVRKTRLFFDRHAEYMEQITHDIALLEKKAAKMNLLPAVRLNGTSDIVWERKTVQLFAMFPNVNFYDYTKIPHRVENWIAGKLPQNYHLTFSRGEHGDADALNFLARGANVAIVFSGNKLPDTYHGYRVIDGDASDLRFLDGSDDGRGIIVGLLARGAGKRDTSGFVIHL